MVADDVTQCRQSPANLRKSLRIQPVVKIRRRFFFPARYSASFKFFGSGHAPPDSPAHRHNQQRALGRPSEFPLIRLSWNNENTLLTSPNDNTRTMQNQKIILAHRLT